jgi:UDP-N-acetylglucosamine 2-epimerase (non-hydrolysing)
MPVILHAVGARPNFVKMAPVVDALRPHANIEQRLVHTGQHYDAMMSDELFVELELPEPDISLGVGSGTHGEQTGRVLIAFERILLDARPDLVVVAGDVNSTVACALAAAKLGISIAHLEAGLRSRDWPMPEEINRVLTDRLSELLFTHSPEAPRNLAAECISAIRVHAVGNTMVDSLLRFESRARDRAEWAAYGFEPGRYVLVTLHRPSNVDDPAGLARIAGALASLSRRTDVIFPMHPRTRARLREAGLLQELEAAGVRSLDPLGYPPSRASRYGKAHRRGCSCRACPRSPSPPRNACWPRAHADTSPAAPK